LAELFITMAGKNKKVGSIKIDRFSKQFPRNLRKALTFAGAILERQIYKNLTKYKGPRKTQKGTFGSEPPATREFPAFRSGTLARSVTFKFFGQGNDLGVIIGPNTVYARVQEVGGGNIPARPYVKPAYDKKKKPVFDGIHSRLMKPIRVA